ncbi:MAG TPA: hypothetical protein VI916_05280 [Acidimicrobiia bacterium]|nr:hypothetical protein [Acidimicrobiia bacterium]
MTILRARPVVVFLALLFVTAACDNGDDSPGDADLTTTSTPQTSEALADDGSPECESPDPKEERNAQPIEGPAFIQWVLTTAEDCSEDVEFEYELSTPETRLGYEIGYADGPFEDPSGRVTPVKGDAFLRVVLLNGTTVDLSQESVRETLAGDPKVAETARLVKDVVMITDFEGVSEWVVGLDRVRPFRVADSVSLNNRINRTLEITISAS